MPEGARKGFEIADDTLEALPTEDEKNPDAFFIYVYKNCGLGDTDTPTAPSDIPSALPSEFPTDFPTELPSDLLDLLTELPSDFGQS